MAPFGIRVNAICPAGMPYTGFMAAGGMEVSGEDARAGGAHTGSMHPLGRPITAEDCAEAAVYLCSDRACQRHRRPASRSTAGTSPNDRDRASSSTPTGSAGSSTWRATSTLASGAPTWRTRTRCGTSCGEQAAVHAGNGPRAVRHRRGPRLPRAALRRTGRTSRRSRWAACDAAYRNPETFASSAEGGRPRGRRRRGRPTACCRWAATSTAATGRWSSPPSRRRRPVVDRELDRADGPRPHRLLRTGGPGRAERRLLRGHPGAHDHRELRPSGRPGARRPRVSEPARTDHGDAGARSWRPAGSSPRTT